MYNNNVEFLNIAEYELQDAVKYYNRQSEGLGYEFALEVKKTIERIVQFPEAWHRLSKNARRCRCNRFPYGVVYKLGKESILIIAIMHLHRNPLYWKDRI